VREKFQALLQGCLAKDLRRPLQPQKAYSTPSPPTPTEAYFELAGVLPATWGICLSQWTHINILKVRFFEGKGTGFNASVQICPHDGT
ncbi:MAG: hypothetical protein ACC628_02380, partial [Pirellulaceae bacterium]